MLLFFLFFVCLFDSVLHFKQAEQFQIGHLHPVGKKGLIFPI